MASDRIGLNRLQVLRWVLALSLILISGSLVQAYSLARRLLVTTDSLPWMTAFVLGGLITFVCFGIFLLSWSKWGHRITSLLARISLGLQPWGRVNYLFSAVLIVGLGALLLIDIPDPPGLLLESFLIRGTLFWFSLLVGASLFYSAHPDRSWTVTLALTALIYGAIYRMMVFLPDISASPLSLTWSEGSRYYYASLFLPERIYGTAAHPSVLHPSRYLLQSIPFLIPRLPIWFHRSWQVFLWIGTNLGAAWLVVRRLGFAAKMGSKINNFWVTGLFLWAFLFLFQGPIWYHLVIMILLVLWGFDSQRFWRSLLIIAAVSAWGGISRINWIPFPAALAALLYLLERPVGRQSIHRYLSPPAGWGLAGLISGLLAQWGYAVWSGNSLEQFGSSFTSDLLWYRLFPNATFPLGVLPGITLVILPVCFAMAIWYRRHPVSLGWIRTVSVLGLLLAFLLGGLVVSAKIGGGSNLHNLDGFLALLMVLGAMVFTDRIALEKIDHKEKQFPLALPWQVLALAIIVPVSFSLSVGSPSERGDPVDSQTEFARLIEALESVSPSGEVLFISQRQLLTFQQVEGIALVEPYEKVFLMEMAMAGNPAYLSQFQADLADRRFELIVSDPVRVNQQSRADEFGEENNAWDSHISRPLLCYYNPVLTLEAARVQLLAPRDQIDCPEPDS